MIQINLHSKWFTLVKYIAFAVIFHFSVGWFSDFLSGTKKNKTQKITIPAVTGSFESKKPESKPVLIKQTPISLTQKEKVIYIPSSINEKLISENEKLKLEYSKMNDSLKTKTYEKSIELNSFYSKFEDENLKLSIDGIVRGEVQGITPSYEIKERKSEVKTKETVLRLLLGAGIGINTSFDRGVYKMDIDVMNRKGDMFSAEYLRVNGQDFGVIGIKKSILNIKK